MDMFEGYPATQTVPDFLGLDYDAAHALERQAQVKLADPDPDAPPLNSYWFYNQHLVVSTQHPSAGSHVYRLASIHVTLAPPQTPIGARTRRMPAPTLSAEAERDTTAT